MLRDLDEVLMPGITHWQSPRFFAYFATTASEPGDPRRAPDRRAQPGRDPLAHLARAAGARGGDARLARAAPRPARGPPRPHRGHGLDQHALGARRRPRRRPGRRVVVCSEHAHSSVDKAAKLLELELRKVPVDDAFRLRTELVDLDDACAVIATIGTTCAASIDPVPGIADAARQPASGFTSMRRTPARRPSVPSSDRLRGLGARGLDRREPAQVARRTHGLLGALDTPSRAIPARRSASSPSTCALPRKW